MSQNNQGGQGPDDTTLLMTPATDKDHLHAWIQYFLGLDFPNHTVSRFSDCNPMDFIWECYDHIVNGKPLALMALAGRDSFKTLGLSVIDLLAFLHDGRDTIHLAMTKAQGARARAYLDQFLGKVPQLRAAIAKQNNTEIRLNVNNQLVGMEILPCTPKAVQGGHCALLTFDELASSMEPNNVRGYKDAHGIFGTSKTGKPAVVIKITSRQAGASLAEQELRNAAKSGIKIRKWTTLDATERCPDDRSGTKPTPLWINVSKGEKFTEEEFKDIPQEKRDGFEYVTTTMDKCRQCPLAVYCQGDLKNQKSTSPLLRTIDDVINKIRLSGSHDWALAQIMSLKPSTEGLVYWEFDTRIHIPGWAAMWTRLTGAPPQPGMQINRDAFIKELKRRKCQFYAGQDFGWTHPAVTIVIAVDRNQNVYVVDQLILVRKSDPEVAELVSRQFMSKYDIQMIAPDIENPGGIHEFKKKGLPVTSEIDKDIKRGVNNLKGWLRVAGTNNETKIMFAPDLQSTVPNVEGILEELELYHLEIDAAGGVSDYPADEFNHALDALRYIMMWLFGKSASQLAVTEFPKQERSLIPEMTDMARQQGIMVNDNREQFQQMGKQEGKKDPDDPDDGGDDGGGSPGGFQFAWT